MSLAHTLAAFASGGLAGVQTCHRDWSPFLVHFTSWSAMQDLRRYLGNDDRIYSASKTKDLLAVAANASFETVKLIALTATLKAGKHQFGNPEPAVSRSVPDRICFTECTLPGFFSHAERFGRFGFVFSKQELFAKGARPCCYLDNEYYALISEKCEDEHKCNQIGDFSRLLGLCNLYQPPGNGRIQDYTHDREWRLQDNLSLESTPPEMIVAPQDHVDRVQELFPKLTIVPLDRLFTWGV